MGVTISNKNHSIDLSYSGFARLRDTIADLLNPEFGDLYKKWTSLEMSDEIGNKLLNNLYKDKKLTDEDDPIIKFLFAPDYHGKIPAKDCKILYNLIKDYDNNIKYGYIGRPDCAVFKDFKNIIETSSKNKWIVTWD